MALWDEVLLRYDTQTLVELTNPRTKAETVNTTLGTRAATAVTATYFPTFAQMDYDSTLAAHVEIGTEGVIAVLFKWGGTTLNVAKVEFDSWVERLRALRNVGPRQKVPPTTSSELTASDEVSGSAEVRPPFDIEQFNGIRLRPPGGGSYPGVLP